MTKPWLRLYRAAINKPKVGRLTLEERGFWVSLLMLSDDDGVLPGEDDVSWAARISGTDAISFMCRFVEYGLVTRDVTEGVTVYRLHDWDEHQHKSDADPTAADRKRRQREREKAQKSAVTRDSHGSHGRGHASVTRTDTDTDTDKTLTSFVSVEPEVKASRSRSLPSDFKMPPQWINDAETARKKAGKPPIDLFTEGERFVNHFVANGKAMKDWRRAWLNWATSPYVDQLNRGANNGRSQRPGFTDTMRDIAGEIRAAEARSIGGGGVPAPGAGGRGVGDVED